MSVGISEPCQERLARAAEEQLASRRRVTRALAGGSLSIPGAILVAMETGPWFIWGYSVAGVALLALTRAGCPAGRPRPTPRRRSSRSGR